MDNYAYQGQPFTPPETEVENYAYQGQPFELWQKPDVSEDTTAFFELF
jgi:hypothetical protein